jgi:hypothetical protein
MCAKTGALGENAMAHASKEARRLSAENIADHKTFEDKVVSAIRASRGNVAAASRILGVSRRTMTRYVATNKSISAVIDEERLKNDTDHREYNRRMQRESRARRAKESAHE